MRTKLGFSDVIKGGLQLISFAGQDAVLATANRSGKIEPTALYKQPLEAAGDIKPKMIGIASSANVFADSEIERSQVQQFIGLLTRLGIIANGAVVLISHPSLTGISMDTGLSGNTQWRNALESADTGGHSGHQIAFFMSWRLAICIAQALSQDHFVERTSRIWAAS